MQAKAEGDPRERGLSRPVSLLLAELCGIIFDFPLHRRGKVNWVTKPRLSALSSPRPSMMPPSHRSWINRRP